MEEGDLSIRREDFPPKMLNVIETAMEELGFGFADAVRFILNRGIVALRLEGSLSGPYEGPTKALSGAVKPSRARVEESSIDGFKEKEEEKEDSFATSSNEWSSGAVAEWIPISGNPPSKLRHGPVRRTGDGKFEFGLLETKIQEFEEAYPALDVRGNIKRARLWCINNPGKRKTYPGKGGGLFRFLDSWLAKAQNSGKSSRSMPMNAPVQEQEYDNELEVRRNWQELERTGTAEAIRAHYLDPNQGIGMPSQADKYGEN